MLKARLRNFRLALLCGALALALLAVGIPDYQDPARAVKHLSTVKAAGSFQAPPVTIFRDDFEADRGWIPNPNATDTAAGQWRRDVSGPTSLGGVPLRIGNANIGNHALLMGRSGVSYSRSNEEIGRASCRERGEIMVMAEAMKRNE